MPIMPKIHHPCGMTTAAERARVDPQRRARIAGKRHIDVSITSPEISMVERGATVTFRQIYVADKLKDENRKMLQLIKHGDQWQIVQEQTIDQENP